MAKAKQIIDEVRQKADDYDGKAGSFLASVAEWADDFRVKPGKRKARTFSNPKQTEFYRAASANAILEYRMMTSADPYFEARPISLGTSPQEVRTLEQVWLTQHHWSGYRANLLRACHFKPVFGTVLCQEDYRIIGASPFGRRIPVTVMIPRVMDQVFFDRGATSFETNDCDFVGTGDVTSPAALKRLAAEAKETDAPWNAKALESAANDKENTNTISQRVLERLRRAGYTDDEAFSKKKELLMYYGKLDCMNDGIEYVVALINRKHLVRFHANNFQHGRRGFRIAKHVDFTGALGDGIGSLFGHTHRGMDANRQKAQDLGSFGAYNMWGRRKNSFVDEDAQIAPLQFIDMDSKDDMWPITPSYQALEGILKLDEILKMEFRAATNASDTLQAIVTDATATASALAQNEAMRAISVRAEQASQALVREHLENMHANNVQNIRAPFNINTANGPKVVYPSDLMIDVDIRAKTTTDKDFQPKRLERMLQMLQVLTSTKSQHPDQLQISILPIVEAIAGMLDVNPSEVILPMGMGGMPQAPMMGAGDMLGMAGLTAPGAPVGGMGVTSTPVGPVLSA